MRFFKNEAKARRKEELEEQHRKNTAVPSTYFHTPTHALKDSLQSVPDANKGPDQQRLKEAHRHRLERETSALAAGSDTNATNVPANYWQGQPLPAQFKAPTPARLRKLAQSRAALRGRKVALPETLPAKKQSQKLVDDEGERDGSRRDMQNLPLTLNQDMHQGTSSKARPSVFENRKARLMVRLVSLPQHDPRKTMLQKLQKPPGTPSWSVLGIGSRSLKQR